MEFSFEAFYAFSEHCFVLLSPLILNSTAIILLNNNLFIEEVHALLFFRGCDSVSDARFIFRIINRLYQFCFEFWLKLWILIMEFKPLKCIWRWSDFGNARLLLILSVLDAVCSTVNSFQPFFDSFLNAFHYIFILLRWSFQFKPCFPISVDFLEKLISNFLFC